MAIHIVYLAATHAHPVRPLFARGAAVKHSIEVFLYIYLVHLPEFFGNFRVGGGHSEIS